jgi:hypothetical protein
MNVIEFWDHPDCLIRVRVVRSDRPLVVANDVISVGEKIVEIHFWNEHVPRIPDSGADMAWAVKGVRMLASSFTELARQISTNEKFHGVKAVGGVTPLFFTGQGTSGERIWKRLGFTMTPHEGRLGRFGEYWENVYTWLIMWAFNPLSVRNQRLLSMRRTEFWVVADEFVRHHSK